MDTPGGNRVEGQTGRRAVGRARFPTAPGVFLTGRQGARCAGPSVPPRGGYPGCPVRGRRRGPSRCRDRPPPVPRRLRRPPASAGFRSRRSRPRMFFSGTVPKGIVDSCCSVETCGQLSLSHVRCRATLRTGLSPAPPGREAGKSFRRQVGSDRTDPGSEPLRGPGPWAVLAGPPSRCPRLLDGCPDRSVSTARPGARDRLWQSPGSISASVSSTSVSGEPAVGSPTKGRVSSGSGNSPGNTGSGGSLWKPPDGSTGGYTPVAGRPRARGLSISHTCVWLFSALFSHPSASAVTHRLISHAPSRKRDHSLPQFPASGHRLAFGGVETGIHAGGVVRPLARREGEIPDPERGYGVEGQALGRAVGLVQPPVPVRRGKARFPGGCEPRPTIVASVDGNPGGSWRQRHGLKHPNQKGPHRRFSDHAGRNVSERRAGPAKGNAGADPPRTWGSIHVRCQGLFWEKIGGVSGSVRKLYMSYPQGCPQVTPPAGNRRGGPPGRPNRFSRPGDFPGPAFRRWPGRGPPGNAVRGAVCSPGPGLSHDRDDRHSGRLPFSRVFDGTRPAARCVPSRPSRPYTERVPACAARPAPSACPSCRRCRRGVAPRRRAPPPGGSRSCRAPASGPAAPPP